MKIEDVIVILREKLRVPVGRHLYGILSDYSGLVAFEKELKGATIVDGQAFPIPFSVNREIIDAFSDDEFCDLVQEEAKRPEPTRASIRNVFEKIIREKLENNNTVILKDLELLFIYNIDFSSLRVLATDQHRIILLLPGKRVRDRITMYPNSEYDFNLPKNLIADNHIWELSY